jgi:hypothetical protein
MPFLGPLDAAVVAEGLVADIEGGTSIATGLIADVEGATNIALQTAQSISMYAEFALIALIVAAEFQAIIDILIGSAELFWGAIKTLVSDLIPDFFDFIITLFFFSYTWMMCLFKNIKNIHVCFFFYILEIIGQILYLPVRVFLFLTSLIKINLYKQEKMFWDFIDLADSIFFKFTKFHFAHYPRNIREQCYNCKRLKVGTLAQHASPLITDLFTTVPKNLGPGLSRIIKGGTEIMHPFDYSNVSSTSGDFPM